MKTKKLALLILFLVSGFMVSAQQVKKCGTWRWDVKTLTDKDGIALLSALPVQSSIDSLVAVKPPKILKESSPSDGKMPRYANENQVVEIIAYVTEVKHELDNDFHFVLKSPYSDNTMVGEIPDPSCPAFDNFPRLKEKFTATRQDGNTLWDALKETKNPVKVKITGVPLWDGVHANAPTGASKYFREIHPILTIVQL